VLFEVGDAVKEKYLELARRSETPFLYKAMELTNETDLSYRYSKNKRFAIELLLIRLCQLKASPEEGDKKKIVIETIEKKTIETVEKKTENPEENFKEPLREPPKEPNGVTNGKSIARVRLNGNEPEVSKPEPEVVSHQVENPIQAYQIEDPTQTLFTDKEKYLYMADKNPNLKNLVIEFNLRLD